LFHSEILSFPFLSDGKKTVSNASKPVNLIFLAAVKMRENPSTQCFFCDVAAAVVFHVQFVEAVQEAEAV
jgi:hypothetical protein